MEPQNKPLSQNYNGFFTTNNNYVWGGAICLAWNQLKNSIIKAPVQLSTNNPTAVRLIQNFNAQRFNDDDIDPACVYVKSGYGPNTLNQINQEVKQKFPQKTTPPLDFPMQDDSIISYAYLLKKLSFIAKFERLPDKNFTFNQDHQVHAFYAQKPEQRKQIQYCEWQNKDNFTIAIKSKNPTDLLFCVKSDKHLTVEQVFEKCNEKQLRAIGTKDEFMMPVVELDLHHSIKELKGLGVKNQGFGGYFITEIFENLKLKIDESGAKVQNEAVIMMNRCMPIIQDLKEFILDKPFWIVMKEAGKHPYLAVLVRNPVEIEQ